jgi:hypothetical protein
MLVVGYELSEVFMLRQNIRHKLSQRIKRLKTLSAWCLLEGDLFVQAILHDPC